MYKSKVFFTAFAAAAAITTLSVSALAAPSAGVVSTYQSPLAVRSSPAVYSQKTASLSKGSMVTLLSESGGWWQVRYADGKIGYCSADYIRELQSSFSAKVTTSGSKLNVRSAASASAAVMDKLSNGEQVIVLSKNSENGFYRVLYKGCSVGYVSRDYISEGKAAAGSSGASVALAVSDFKQTDPRWANVYIGSSGKTMKSIGCVTAALADTESYRLGNSSLTPAAMAKKLSYNASGDVYWPSNYAKYTGSDYLTFIRNKLNAGKPVIIGAKNSYGKTHWVVVTGFSGAGTSSKDFTINDPGSASRTRLSELFAEYPVFYKIEYYL